MIGRDKGPRATANIAASLSRIKLGPPARVGGLAKSGRLGAQLAASQPRPICFALIGAHISVGQLDPRPSHPLATGASRVVFLAAKR